MLAEATAAAMVGVSFGNSWVCFLISLGTRTHSRKMAASFILGRFLGIMVLGSLMALFGLFLDIPAKLYTLIFGIITLLFAAYIFVQHIIPRTWISRHVPWMGSGCSGCESSGCGTDRSSGCGTDHSSECNTDHSSVRGTDHSSGCSTDRSSGCNTDHSSGCGGCSSRSRGRLTAKSGFLYGAFRGATPCLKMMILAPLLITTGMPNALLLTAVFATASTLYPIIGFLAGGLITEFATFRDSRRTAFALNLVSMIILLGMGIYYIFRYFTAQCAMEGV